MSDLAGRQLADLAEVSGGAIQLAGTEVRGNGQTVYTVSLDTSGIVTRGAGIRIRGRERFELWVSPEYPYAPPSVLAQHDRWAGTPHVQWRRQLCLYAAPSVEWSPADGMRGLIERLMLWLESAAIGELDPAGQPLHPPVAYPSSGTEWVVVRSDLGDMVPWAPPGDQPAAVVYAACTARGNRIDVEEWLTGRQVLDRLVAGTLNAVSEQGSCFIAPGILVSVPLDSMEYPKKASALALALGERGFPADALLDALVLAISVNKAMGVSVVGDGAAPLVVFLGAPARRIDPDHRLAHLTAWHLDNLGARITELLQRVDPDAHAELAADVRDLANDWLGFADVQWMVLHEARPEVTRRRDGSSPAAWLTGKRVLVLGCGALGAPIAEQCVRAGVERLHVVDKAVVKPGILVRQPYDDGDIGHPKANILAGRLSVIRSDLDVTCAREDVVTALLRDPERFLGYDVIVDATADASVRAALEKARAAKRDRWPATVGGLFGHTAERGLVTISLPGATGSTHDILRRLAIDIVTQPPPGWESISDDFFPREPRTEKFFPEPGCSDPTFTGSASQVTGLASVLFNAALTVLVDVDAAPMTALGLDLAREASGTMPRPLHWSNDVVLDDESGDFEVRISARAMAEMRAEGRRGARVRGPKIETGGMLLGSIDEGTQTVYVDAATGPSPDSHLSAVYFDHGVAGTQERVSAAMRATLRRVGFVGMWHSHPFGVARPSATDEVGIMDVLGAGATGRNALMLILGGSASWSLWLKEGGAPDVYARVARRSSATNAEPRRETYLVIPARWFAGGYAYPGEPAVDTEDAAVEPL